ncbi:MAG: endolytic transglycosylase MltG, partial [Armatimonadota bacterium]
LTRVVIAPKMGVGEIGDLLARRGLIRSAGYWRFVVARGARPKPGTYDLSPAERPEVLLRALVEGRTATVRVTFPEGWTVAQMARRLESKGLVPSADLFIDRVRVQGADLDAVFVGPADREGYLFPDTYRFPLGSSETAIASMLLANFEHRVAGPLADAVRASGRPLREIVVIASLVEREARTDRDRPLIAGVIENRLRKGMRLEIDATVQYARGVHAARLFHRDLRIDSPYNTYRRTGLPPGPICNPGLPSLEAAARPARHDFLFYVLGKDGRNHEFSKTYGEHLARIRRIRAR